MTVVCGDSHTSTHGAFGALAFGIGTSQVEHVLATQTLPIAPFKTMSVTIDGDLPSGSGAKDIILAIIAKIGTNGAQGHVIEYRGRAIEQLSMEARMTICNMSIEGGARAGMIAPDQTTFDYLKDRPHAPVGEDWDAAVEYWSSLRTDSDAVFDTEVVLQAEDIEPFVTWGTNPGQGLPLSARVPDPEDIADATERLAAERALEYMDLVPGTPLRDIKVDTVFIGSCTNGRIEDLRAAAEVVRGRKKAEGLRMLVVPAFGPGASAGRGRGAGPGLHELWCRVAQRRLLHVPGHEPRQALLRGARGLHLQPQLRGTSRKRRTDSSRLARRRRGHRRAGHTVGAGGPASTACRFAGSRRLRWLRPGRERYPNGHGGRADLHHRPVGDGAGQETRAYRPVEGPGEADQRQGA